MGKTLTKNHNQDESPENRSSPQHPESSPCPSKTEMKEEDRYGMLHQPILHEANF